MGKLPQDTILSRDDVNHPPTLELWYIKFTMKPGVGDYEGRKIRVLLVDDHPVVRDGVRLSLRDEPDIEVVGEASDAEEALQGLAELQPDVVLMDLHLPGLSGLDATVQVRAMYPGIKVIILTVHNEGLYLCKALKAGASGYLLKDAPARLIPQTLRAAVLGSAVVPLNMIAGMIASPSGNNGQALEKTGLTSREVEVLGLIAEGNSNREIATRLELAEGTVKKYVQNLIGKLHCKDRAHAAVTALRGGLLD